MTNRLTKFLCCLLLMLTFSLQGAYANDDFEQKYNFMATDNGNGSIHFRLLVWSYGTIFNHWAGSDYRIHADSEIGEILDDITYYPSSSPREDGNQHTFLEYSTDGEEWYKFLEYSGDNVKNKNSNFGYANVWVVKEKGSIAVTNMRHQLGSYYLNPDSIHHEVFLNETDEEGTKYLEFDWYPVNEIASKKNLQLRVTVCDRKVNVLTWRDPYEIGKFNLSNALPQLYTSDALLYPDGEGATAGKLAIPYTTHVTPVSYQIGNDGKVNPCSESSGFVYVDACDTCNNAFYLKMDALRNGDGDNPAENWHLVSKPIKVRAYHSISNFILVPDGDYNNYDGAFNGNKKLLWDVLNANQEDVMPTDKFLVYRAYKSDFSDEEFVASLDYKTINSDFDTEESERNPKRTTAHYEYIDTVPDAYCNRLDPEQPIYYRVQRASSLMWGTSGHAWVKRGMIKDPVYLSRLDTENIKVEKLSKESSDRTIKFTIPLQTYCQTTEGSEFIPGWGDQKFSFNQPMWWDKSAQIILHRHMESSTEGVVDIPVNPNNMYYDSRSKLWIATVTDVPNLPCTKYTYTVEIVPSDNPIYPVLTDSIYACKKYTIYHDWDIDDGIDYPDETCYPIEGNQPKYVSQIDTTGLNLYFDTAAKVTGLKASQGEYNDRVLLSWSSEGGESDYYKIYRSYTKKDKSEVKDELVQDLYTEHYYEDKNVVGGVEYTYHVVSVLECGKEPTTASSEKVKGYANSDAFITGSVQYTNGVAIDSIKVVATRERADGTTEVYSDTTDVYGQFKIRIPNRPEKGVNFTVSVEAGNGTYTIKGSGTSYTVMVGEDSEINLEGYDFYSKDFVRFTGRVLYENTTVPVPGVAFEINGKRQKNVEGNDIVTDSQGEFSLTVPKNKDVKIRAVKEGHKFLNDGRFYILVGEQEKDNFSLTSNIDNVRMYDQTKVRLIGRVAGGKDEARKPLGKGESKNLIGDDLQLVFALEGNDVAHLIHNPKDLTVASADTTFAHKTPGQFTKMRTEKKRLLINPDSITGEFLVELLPVKYEITQASAKGYSTLFGQNMTSAVIDLTDKFDTLYVDPADKSTSYNDTYVLTYHTPLRLTYQQMYYGQKVDYFGEPEMVLSDFSNEKKGVKLYDKDKKKYTFKYPVFNGVSQNSKSKNKYTFFVSAHEDYYYNNDSVAANLVQVPLHEGKVKVSNGFDADPSEDYKYVILDDKGTGTAIVTIDNASFVQTQKDALRTMKMSMEVDGLCVESDTLKAFLTGARMKGSDIIATDITIQDVLRDPPGSASYAWIEEGTTYTNTYTVDYSWDFGIAIESYRGNSLTNVVGTATVAGSQTSMTGGFKGDVITTSDTFTYPTVDVVMHGRGQDTYQYSYTLNQRIQTSSSDVYVGNDGNVFIGSELQTQMDRYQTICVIDNKSLELHKSALESDAMKLIWSGTDENGDSVHLVIADQVGFLTLPKATFAYAQKHILQNLLPEMVQARDALILSCDSTQAQAIANDTGKIQYYTKNGAVFGDDKFGTSMKYYGIVFPSNYRENKDTLAIDEVGKFNNRITQWQKAIGHNERVMLDAILVGARNDVAVTSGTSKEVSETTTYARGFNGYTSNPFTTGESFWTKLVYNLERSAILGTLEEALQNENNTGSDQKKKSDAMEHTIAFDGNSSSLKLTIKPVADFDWQESSDVNKNLSRTVGYVIEEENQGHINVAVYRTPKAVSLEEKNFYYILDSIAYRGDYVNATEVVEKATTMTDGKLTGLTPDECVPGDFVYYLLGGATRAPWEPESTTRFYMPGTKLGNATLKIDDPKIYVENPVISNVPTDQPAVFDLILSNESQVPAANDFMIEQALVLAISYDTNPNGAKLFVDGQPISSGVTLYLPRNVAVHKKLELYRGSVDDYEDIELVFYTDAEPANCMCTKISAHFQPTSCEVNLTSPTDKWVMNTLSPNDEKGYYIPVKIDGFNVKYHNFDHIELQYKKASQPDESYVNLCSYYADEKLYNEASGNKAMIRGSVIDDIFFYGETDPMEQKYDLRAVSFCRLGNGYVTRSSKVLSGTKDTRLPEVFGALSPKNGILGMGDYIGISFSEAIAGNYLDKDNNFEVVGYTNKTGIINSTSLTFDGAEDNAATTQITRNLTGKDFTIDLMMKVANEKLTGDNNIVNERMVFFSQGSADNNIEFGLTKESCLYLKWNNSSSNQDEAPKVVSKVLGSLDTWQRVAATYNDSTGEVRFFVGNQEWTAENAERMASGYNGAGVLKYGTALNGKYPFTGNMLEARLWTRELDYETLTATKETALTGYERKLLAYYPMNEGRGKTIEDKANGATLTLGSQTWSLPLGLSLRFKGNEEATHGVQLDNKFFNRSKLNNYTLSFWFKADKEQDYEDVALYSEGNYATGGLYIGLEGGKVALRQNDTHEVAQGNWRDGEWHQLSLTVDRMKNVAHLYIDGKNTNQFSSDGLGALGSQDIWLGARIWSEVKDGEKTDHSDGYLKGNIDDIMLWESALSEGYLKQFYNAVPNGGEMGLLVNLTFGDSDFTDMQMPVANYDPKNQLADIERNSMRAGVKLVLTDASGRADWQSYAPVREKDLLSQMNFSWASKDNELVINLNMADKEINKQNVFITVRDVEDLAGNAIKDPVVMTVFVDRNQLKWGNKYVTRNVKYGESDKFSVDIRNHGGTTLSYIIEDLPSWLTVDMEQGTLNPTNETPVNFTVNKNLDPGEHSALIYLTDEKDLSEPLLVTVNVEAEKPNWAVDRTKYPDNMNIIASVWISERKPNGEEHVYHDTNSEDIVGAFVGNTCLGVQNIDASKGLGSLYMSIYGNDDIISDDDVVRHPIEFRLWRANTGKVYILTPMDTTYSEITFKKNAILGSAAHPVEFKTMLNSFQVFNLDEGWNWISFNINPETNSQTINGAIRGNYQFSEGDVIKTDGGFVQYDGTANGGSWRGTDLKTFYAKNVYMVNVKKAGQIEIAGTEISAADRKFDLQRGWNHFPYYSDRICSLREALAAYSQNATEGDIIKSYDKFAMYSDDGWVGSLGYMTPGEGYLFFRNGTTTVPFSYTMSSEVTEHPALVKSRSYMPAEGHSGNMPIVAKFITSDGAMSVQGDVLRAYSEGNLVGEATADAEGRFFLMTSAENGAPISFRISTAGGPDSEAGATASNMLDFDETTSVGTVKSPFVIDFRNHHIGAFPSPFTDVITFSADTNPGDVVEVSVYDTAGSKVFGSSESAQTARYTLTTHKLSHLVSGVYIVRITVAGVPHAIKIIKQ